MYTVPTKPTNQMIIFGAKHEIKILSMLWLNLVTIVTKIADV